MRVSKALVGMATAASVDKAVNVWSVDEIKVLANLSL